MSDFAHRRSPDPGSPRRASPGRTGVPARWRRVAATVGPVALPGAMHLVFRAAVGRFGQRRGYQAGFAAYWAACWLVAITVAGPARLFRTFDAGRRPLPAPRALALAALAGPPLGALITEFLPQARRVGGAAIGASIFIGTTNALAEEAFWRALPVAVFPDDRARGWLWPAGWFAVWHLVPLAAAGAGPRRVAEVLAGAALIGAGYGWIAVRTGSVTPVLVPHAIADASGVRPVSRLWLGRPDS